MKIDPSGDPNQTPAPTPPPTSPPPDNGPPPDSGPPPPKKKTPQDYYNALMNDPFYLQSKAYIDAGNALALANLQNQENIANQKYGLSAQEIAQQEKDAQLKVTNTMAYRQSLESGDNAYYHNKVAQNAAFQMQSAQLNLADYLAGVQAAYAQHQLDSQQQLVQALYDAANFEIQNANQINGTG